MLKPKTKPAKPGPRIHEVREGCCKFPLGKPLDRPEFFCGKPALFGESWCAEHHRIVYVPGSSQRVRPPKGV